MDMIKPRTLSGFMELLPDKHTAVLGGADAVDRTDHHNGTAAQLQHVLRGLTAEHEVPADVGIDHTDPVLEIHLKEVGHVDAHVCGHQHKGAYQMAFLL